MAGRCDQLIKDGGGTAFGRLDNHRQNVGRLFAGGRWRNMSGGRKAVTSNSAHGFVIVASRRTPMMGVKARGGPAESSLGPSGRSADVGQAKISASAASKGRGRGLSRSCTEEAQRTGSRNVGKPVPSHHENE